MAINIQGLDKSELLLALYNNAKSSDWTRATIRNLPFLTIPNLTVEQAKEQLSRSSYVDYIGPVLIKINFSRDSISTDIYDRDNTGVKTASKIVEELKAATLTIEAGPGPAL